MPPPVQKKRDIADFFRPHGQTGIAVVPQKRPSPSSANEDNTTVRRPQPKTPVKRVTFKDVTPRSIKSLFFSPTSQGSLPIRSPKPNHTASPSKDRQTRLFEDVRVSPKKEIEPKINSSFTFSDISERSQNVIENGKIVAVRDSDDDTESLESLDDILGRRKDAGATSDSSPPEDMERERVKTLSMFTFGRSVPIVGKEKLRALNAKEKAIKFDLSGVLDDHFGDEEAQVNIKRMRADFNGAMDLDDDDRLDKKLLADVVRTGGDADQDDVDRILHAVERTEALSADKKFSFFKVNSHSRTNSPHINAFPRTAIPDQMWIPKDTDARDRAFLSGYMTELALCGDLADEAVKWNYEQVVKEPRDDLRKAYIECLGASSKTWTRLNISATDVQSLFQDLGGDTDCLRDSSPIQPKYQPISNESKPDYRYLQSALEMYRVICKDMDFSALSKLASILLRLALDSSVMSNNRIGVAVENLLETLLQLPEEEARSHVYDRLLSDATAHVLQPQLQVQLLHHILPSTLR